VNALKSILRQRGLIQRNVASGKIQAAFAALGPGPPDCAGPAGALGRSQHSSRENEYMNGYAGGMPTTVNIPDSMYRELKVFAAAEGSTVPEIILEAVAEKLRNRQSETKVEVRAQFPVIRSKDPGSLKLGEEGVYGHIPFP
jgi:hypothetical protein